jgi:NodT family efflux transporter outer membrane factor (OMF) lipoprotein
VIPPASPPGVPSTLLQRRPDIAAAERRMAAANAEIGVAKAAYFPSLTISASGGYQSSSFADWISLPNRFWSVGPAAAMTLFDGGARSAQTDQAVAAYDQNVAVYRQTVLTAFQDVEDNLVALHLLEQEASVQDEAVAAALESVKIATNQYKAGTVSYLNVVTAQTAAYSNQRSALTVLNSRLASSVLLIKALGGGWHGNDADGTAPAAKDEAH